MTAVMELAATLPQALLAGVVPPADQDDLARGMHVRRFKADEVLYHRGDNATYASVVQVTRESYWRILDRNPKACGPMFAHLGRTIQKLEARYEDLVFQDVPGRLAKYLLEIDQQGTRLPITQDDLAAAIGSTRVTVNKLLADLERRGVISVDRRRIEVKDREALEKEMHR